MKKTISYIIIIYLILIVAGCKCKSQPEYQIIDGNRVKIEKKSNELIDKFTLAKNADLFAEISSRNFINTSDILDIIGSKIGEKATDSESNFLFKATLDTREIQEAKVDLFNAKYDIRKSKLDSVSYQVEVKKPILKGGSVYQVLSDLGMEAKHIGFYAWKLGEYIDATSIDVGDTLFVDYYLDSLKVKKFNKFSYKNDKISVHEFFIRGERELEYNLITHPFQLVETFFTGEVTKDFNSMDRAMASLGISSFVRQQANDAIESQLALSKDARVGDTFELLVQEKLVNGEVEPQGKVLYAAYSGKRTGSKSAYRFVDDNDASAFNGMYTETGKGLVQGNIRTPLNLMHITSPYGYRIHPILGRRILHQGMDLRGSTGTPVFAVTSGTVIKATNSGDGYGNDVRIRHDNGMVTQYAHLHRINTRKGRYVSKGQVIGTVGSTGRSTGPHLHFGVMLNGKWVNPRTNLKMVAANKLEGERKTMFLKQVEDLKGRLALGKQSYYAKLDNNTGETSEVQR
ncbi:M23 family metallopeptidase [bacterium]|nr:M23 family metallopeptidase [bacterium]